ncbi:methylcobalamin:coenzyme M methyltransferase [Peptococcaceae bacterium CEB3]|nr:methylcobalamin:coenzyme M methyltransferase [Peptococcaceae bacterium CEB3]
MILSELIDQVKEASVESQERNGKKEVKFIVGLGRTLLKSFIPFTLTDYFNNPEICLETQLKWKLFWHKEIRDDTVVRAAVGVDYVVALEPSLFGVESIFSENTDPTYGKPIIKERDDIERLKVPDFYKSGLMPRVHAIYSTLQELVKGEIPILFPGFARGPWSVACMLRGFTPLYYDLMDDPAFVHRLMNFIVTSRIEWERERCKFLGIKPQDLGYRWNYCVYRDPANSDQYNDEVDGSLFSLATYREFILPYEKKLADFYGGVDYYHSCGNLTPFLPYITQLKGLRMLHVSPHTDLGLAYQLRKPETILQISLDPVNDIVQASAVEMEAKARQILVKTKGENVQIWADALYEGAHYTLEQVKTWLEISRDVYAEFKATKASPGEGALHE